MKTITVEEVQFVAHTLAQQLMTWNEPIPPFVTRFPNALESCISQPFLIFSNKPLYNSLEEKAAVMFYLMIKNHPFQNGNKRIAVTTLLYFLKVNGKWLRIDNQELYNFAVFVAESPPKFMEGMVLIIKEFIESYQIELPDSA